MKDLTLRIGGEGGDGIISCGEILTKTAARSGYHIFTFRTYPAEIRGGLAMFQLRVDDEPVLSSGDKLDLFMAFNQEAIDNYLTEVRQGGIVLFDPDDCPDIKQTNRRKFYEVPITAICKQATGDKRGKNIVALGVLSYLLGLPLDVVAGRVKEKFAKKGDKVVGSNILALVAGFSFGSEKLALKRLRNAPAPDGIGDKYKRMILSGNQAIAIGSLAAGVRFCAGYPITPATPIFEFLARELPRFGGHLIQFEDEIGAIGACLGASYSGQKVLTPTSGPGIALMGEFINLASMAELPIVIVDVQRSGPSTGMPTKTEQGDLNFAMYGTPGDAPRVVLAPGTVQECFEMAVMAVNIAERYQMPVILLSDASLAYRTETIKRIKPNKIKIWTREEFEEDETDEDQDYRRYELTSSGVSPMATPGTDHGYYQATGLEHDEYGRPNYTPKYHEVMLAKRHNKMHRIEKDLGKRSFDVEQTNGAKIGIVSWGSTKGAVREALKIAASQGIKVSHFHTKILTPLPKMHLKDFLSKISQVLVVEENFSGQFARLLRSELGISTLSLTKYGGIPFTPEEITKTIFNMVKK